MNGFVPANIGSICRLVNGRAFKPSDWATEGIPIVRIQNLNDTEKPFNYYNGTPDDKHVVDSGDVLLSWSGTPGTSFGCFIWNRGKGVVNQHIFKVHVDEKKVDKDYFVFAVNSVLDEMIAQAHGGVGLRHITKGKLEALQIPVHRDLCEQKRIVSRIRELLERIEEIGDLRREIVMEAAALPVSMIEEAMQAFAGTATTLGNVCNIVSSLVDPRESKYQNLLHVGGANIVSGTGAFVDLKTAREEELISGKYLFTTEDVLYSKIRPYLRKAARPEFDGLCSADMYPLRVIDSSLLDRGFLFYLLLSRRFTDYANQVSNRAGMPKINRDQLFAYKFSLPSLKEQKQIVERADRCFSSACGISEYVSSRQRELASIKHSVLKKAFAGEL